MGSPVLPAHHSLTLVSPVRRRVHVSPFCMFLRLELTRRPVCSEPRLRAMSQKTWAECWPQVTY